MNIDTAISKLEGYLEGAEDTLATLKADLKAAVLSNYKALREVGTTVQEAWNETLDLTAQNLQRKATEILQTQPRLQPVAVPLIAMALAPEAVALLSGMATVVLGLKCKEKIDESRAHKDAGAGRNVPSRRRQGRRRCSGF